ncbi:MAG TPA: hypothetical protein VMW66_02330 [Elusimicrobiales bacterium]|nr:hypothetical protein [Elusimicrobiales bacterium]
MRLNTKPAIYLIDGLNFVRSFLRWDLDDEEIEVKKFLDWLEGIGKLKHFRRSQFRVIFDGVYRNVGSALRGNLKVHFSDDVKADELLLEQAFYLKSKGSRAVIVTNDADVCAEAKAGKIKVLTCSKFFDICESAKEEF